MFARVQSIKKCTKVHELQSINKLAKPRRPHNLALPSVDFSSLVDSKAM